MSVRDSAGRVPDYGVAMYGGPSPRPWEPPRTPEFPMAENIDITTATKIGNLVKDFEKARSVRHTIRVSTRREEDGTIKIKVHVDGKLVCESESTGTTITVETEV